MTTSPDGQYDPHEIVAPGPRNPRMEFVVAALLVAAAICALAFIVVYSMGKFPTQHELMGITLAASFAFVAAALVLLGERVLPSEEVVEDYPEAAPEEEQEEVAKVMEESSSGITRKRLLVGAGGTAGGAIGLAAITPALSMGPWLEVAPLYRTPWRPGRRLVDDEGKPYKAEEIEQETFYTAYAEGSSDRNLGASLIVVRVDPAGLKLPPDRVGWAPEGILAFSKICPHAGCAVAIYRKPKYGPTQPRSALICPCHYSTFDPRTGGELLFGPAGRPLPQLPLTVDAAGEIRAGGNFSGAIGPSWWGIEMEKPH